MEVWTRWRVGVGASFSSEGVVQGRSERGHVEVNVKKKRQKKGEPLITPSSSKQPLQPLKIGHGGGFGQAHLFAQGSCLGTVRNTPSEVKCDNKKRQKKANH